jgi:hypothetical protein
MMAYMKHRLLTFAFAAVPAIIVVLSPLFAFAAKDEEETSQWEARLEGYASAVRLDEKGTALTWLIVIVLSALAVATMLKNAKRTHLD